MTLLQSLADAVALGALLALVAMGLGLMFGVMRLINFASVTHSGQRRHRCPLW